MTPSIRNTFISPAERKKNILPYYGEFIASKSLDDGWNEQVLPELVSSILESSTSLAEQDIIIEQQEYSDRIKVILSATKISPETIAGVFHISKKLQDYYRLNPVVQKVWYNFSDDSFALPYNMQDPEKIEHISPRWELQNMMSQIEKVQSTIVHLQYINEQFWKHDNKDTDILTSQLQANQEQIWVLSEYLTSLQEELPKYIQIQHLTIAQNNISTGIEEVSGYALESKLRDTFHQQDIVHTPVSETSLTESQQSDEDFLDTIELESSERKKMLKIHEQFFTPIAEAFAGNTRQDDETILEILKNEEKTASININNTEVNISSKILNILDGAVHCSLEISLPLSSTLTTNGARWTYKYSICESVKISEHAVNKHDLEQLYKKILYLAQETSPYKHLEHHIERNEDYYYWDFDLKLPNILTKDYQDQRIIESSKNDSAPYKKQIDSLRESLKLYQEAQYHIKHIDIHILNLFRTTFNIGFSAFNSLEDFVGFLKLLSELGTTQQLTHAEKTYFPNIKIPLNNLSSRFYDEVKVKVIDWELWIWKDPLRALNGTLDMKIWKACHPKEFKRLPFYEVICLRRCIVHIELPYPDLLITLMEVLVDAIVFRLQRLVVKILLKKVILWR